jgi:hypothetical protein
LPKPLYDIAILVYAAPGVERNALTEEKYKALAEAFRSAGVNIQSVSYNDEVADSLTVSLQQFDAVLVWINPIEQGNDRIRLDQMLSAIAAKGCYVSSHPETILKMGTKDILYKTKDMDWGGDVRKYTNPDQFATQFEESLRTSGTRVLKQYRGNGGNGVFKVQWETEGILVTHAAMANEPRLLTFSDFLNEFSTYVLSNGMLIDQPWHEHMMNGIVRCYVSGNQVAGFGYQEINAFYPSDSGFIPPGKRYYYTENCGLFVDLRTIMQTEWISMLQSLLSISNNMMPVIWDADFFINNMHLPASKKYTLCEINASCVSPFPPSAVKYIVEEVIKRLQP